jgi:hypothetical protein
MWDLWITLILFSGLFVGQWYYGFTIGNSWQENPKDTFENCQSEFLQLICQFATLVKTY